jgi:hypothetical protein
MSEPRQPAAGPRPRPETPTQRPEQALESASGAPRKRPLDPSIIKARTQVRAAQSTFEDDLDTLSDATRSAMDIPAKIRKSPVKSAALAGGAGFLLLGGPRRVMGAVISKVAPKRKRDPYDGLLPAQIERVLRDTGAADLPGVREALERDFAEYLKRKGKAEDQRPSAADSLWRTYDAVVGPMGTVAARLLVERLFAADRGRPRTPD